MKNYLLLTTALAFDSGNGWKLDDDGHIVLKDGNPVYLDANGAEMTVEQGTIARLNSEAKTHREGKQSAENALKAFEGLDASKAREALEKLEKLNGKELIDAGKVDELKAQITQQLQTQIDAVTVEKDKVQANYDALRVNNVFSNSEFVRNNLAVPRDMFEATFKEIFKIEDGNVVIYDKAGNRLLSKSRAGEYADAEEALQLLVDAHPQKDSILKADLGSGSGNKGGAGGTGPGRTIRRADFEKLAPGQQAELAGKISAGEMNLTD